MVILINYSDTTIKFTFITLIVTLSSFSTRTINSVLGFESGEDNFIVHSFGSTLVTTVYVDDITVIFGNNDSLGYWFNGATEYMKLAAGTHSLSIHVTAIILI